jgi:Ca2+-binding EF-hand superfamily protein
LEAAMAAGAIRWWVRCACGLGVALALASPHQARAYTAKEAKAIFDILDDDHDGKVTKLEFEAEKIDAFYFRNRKNPEDTHLKYEETGLSRAFFDKADQGHKGYLTGLDFVDAIHFEDIDVKHRGYFDFNDFVMGLKSISR